jgi:hypothetical protein
VLNTVLQHAGVELRETAAEGGYPVFAITSSRGAVGRPKNVIFASSIKPDIRFRDAVNNDIEIATNADKVLVYDRPIGSHGLPWRDLQEWWAESSGQPNNDEAKKSLYHRLRNSLPSNSPPQLFLFETFYKSFYKSFGSRAVDLPALLPEVWLHWDPRTVGERGANALLRFRMDFLLLLPHGHRVVIEVDGHHHYSDDGAASPARYAAMMAADRDLRLAGYEVFRFGASELDGSQRAAVVVTSFFHELFKTLLQG